MNYDFLPGTPFQIRQPDSLFHFTSDSTHLSRFMHIRKKDSVIDVGCNTGALLLYAANRQPASLTGVDIIPEAIAIARENAERNGVKADFFCERIQDFQGGPYDVMICNPPYYEIRDLQSVSRTHCQARSQLTLTPEDVFDAARRLVKSSGRLYIVYRASKLNDILRCAYEVKMSATRLSFLYTREKKPAKTVLMELKFQRSGDVLVEEPLILYAKQPDRE